MRAAIPKPKQTLFPSRDGREIRNSETAPLTDMDPVRTREIRPIALQPGHDLRLAEAKGAANEMTAENRRTSVAKDCQPLAAIGSDRAPSLRWSRPR